MNQRGGPLSVYLVSGKVCAVPSIIGTLFEVLIFRYFDISGIRHSA